MSREQTLTEFVHAVRSDYYQHRDQLKRRAQDVLGRRAVVVSVSLTGSYATGSRKAPREESDVDLLVRYKGAIEPDRVAARLYEKLTGMGGTYDIVPVRV